MFFGGLSLWLSLREPDLCSLTAEGQSADSEIMPCFLAIQSIQKLCVTGGLLDEKGLCVFVPTAGQDSSGEQSDSAQPIELFVRIYGEGTRLAERLIEQVRAWDTAGRPSSKGLRVRIYPRDTEYTPSTDEYIIEKKWTKIVLDWV